MDNNANAHPTEILDSLLHPNLKRVILGGVCGVAAGCVLLLLSTFFTAEGASKLWWLQLLRLFALADKLRHLMREHMF
jgi:hypothetical protein